MSAYRPTSNDMFLPSDDLFYPTHHAAPVAAVPSHHPPQQMEQQEPQPAQDFLVANDASTARSSFPEKLHGLIMDAETMGFQDVISWQDSGKSFKVHKPQIFQNDIIPKYFKPIKYTSFQRQLSIYGFQRIRTGWNTGGYEHLYFTRENPTMCRHIRRHQKPTAFTVKPASTVAAAPPTPTPVASSYTPESPLTSIDEDLFKMYSSDMDPIDAALAQMKNESTTVSAIAPATKFDHHDFEPLPLGSTCLPLVSSHHEMQQQQHDNAEDPLMLEKLQSCFQVEETIEYGGIIENPLKAVHAEETACASACATQQNNNKGAFFPAKLHQLLEDAERMNFGHIVSWTDNGRAFQIHNQKEFVSKIMGIYFDQSKFASFRRQLNLYGFNRTRTNNNKNMYFHENFVQGDPEQCEQMFRRCSGGANNKPSAPTVTSFAA